MTRDRNPGDIMTRPSSATAHTLATALLLCAAVVGGGCASTGAPDEGEPIVLIVENRRPETVTIYAVRHSTRFRIGTVSGVAREQFVLRRHMLGPGGELRLAIDPLGDPNRRFTRVIHVREGDTLELQLVF